MRLATLIKGLDVKLKGSRDTDILNLCENSKLASPGTLFIARRGKKFDGNVFVLDAIAAGALAILSDIYNPFLPKNIAQVLTESLDAHTVELCARFYQNPSRELFVTGITGTNGKTTTAYLTRHLLCQSAVPCGCITTIENICGRHHYSSTHTTPDLITTQRLLREMSSVKERACAMEVSSHALSQGRLDGVLFDCAVFTNLAHDHLDYHETMENYASAKALLFSKLKPSGTAILNADDPWFFFMKKALRSHSLLTYGFDKTADLSLVSCDDSLDGQRLEICRNRELFVLKSPLFGRHNASNALAATAAALSAGVSISDIQKAIKTFQAVPGRLQRVPNDAGLNIFVDYAVTAESLHCVLTTLKSITKQKIICVFGCGGDRDQKKRPAMGKVSSELADMTFITSDNPRSEDPKAICEAIFAGCTHRDRCAIEVDRKAAITKAIESAKRGDCILISGKGHEKTQVFSSGIVSFDDVAVARELCALQKELP